MVGVVAALSLATAAAAAAPSGDRVTGRLRQQLARASASDWLAVGVTLREDDLPASAAARREQVRARQDRVLAALAHGSYAVRRRYALLSGVALVVRSPAIEILARHPEVLRVYIDGRVHPNLTQGRAIVGADAAHGLGITGAGVNAVIIDSGIDTDHPDLSDDLVDERCYCSDTHPSPVFGSPCCPNGGDFQSGSGAAEDDDGHGTSVSGIITSAGAVASTGVAPDAGVIVIRVLGPDGGAFSDIAAALDWTLLNVNAYSDPIRVVNMSLSDGVEYDSASTSPCSGSNTANAIEALHTAGVAVFAASGNDGFDDGIAFPACNGRAISVGGVYDTSFTSVAWCGNANCTTTLCTDTNIVSDTFVCHSNSDELLDLLAPNFQTATSGLGGTLATSFGGTSAASPYAAAEAALLFQAAPSLTPDEMLALLISSGPSVSNPDNGLSFPRPDVSTILPGLLPGDNAGLASLGATGFNLIPSFDADITSYAVEVPPEQTSVTLTATAADAGATISGTGAHAVTTGANPLPVTVTAEDAVTQKTYTLTVEVPNAKVPALSLAGRTFLAAILLAAWVCQRRRVQS